MPELVVGQAGKELTHNQALAILDQLAQPSVVDKDLAAPPGSPANGSMYIVAAAATGEWAGQSGKLACWLDSVLAWTFIAPANGWRVFVVDESMWYQYSGSAWASDDTVWSNLTLTNTWAVSGGLTPQWRRVKGVVYLRGKCQHATFASNGTAAFTLASGSRPGQTSDFAVLGGATNVTAAKASITTAGVASLTDLVTASGTVYVSLSGISFAV
jgi:hypothetical protein